MQRAPATPAVVSPARAAAHSAVPARRVLSWRRDPHATYYNVQLFRNGRKVFEAWPLAPRIAIPKRWFFDGKTRSLTAGAYDWYAWPGLGPLSEARYGKKPTQASFVVPR